jgi:hypothetical protein
MPTSLNMPTSERKDEADSAIHHHGEVVASVNEITRLLSKTSTGKKPRTQNRKIKSNLTRNEMLRALTAANEALEQLEEDDSYHKRIKTEPIYRKENEDLYRDILRESKKFESRFISSERAALRKAGLSEEARGVLLRQTRSVRKEVKTLDIKGDHLSMHHTQITELRESVSSLTAELESLELDQPKEKRRIHNDLRKIAKFVGGIAIIGADVAFADPVTKAISSAIGGALLGQGMNAK